MVPVPVPASGTGSTPTEIFLLLRFVVAKGDGVDSLEGSDGIGRVANF